VDKAGNIASVRNPVAAHLWAVAPEGSGATADSRGNRSGAPQRERTSAESPTGSAWRWTIFHSPFSRRKIVVLRSTYDVGSESPTDAVVRSIASRLWSTGDGDRETEVPSQGQSRRKQLFS
jgi:hypothetical protein